MIAFALKTDLLVSLHFATTMVVCRKQQWQVKNKAPHQGFHQAKIVITHSYAFIMDCYETINYPVGCNIETSTYFGSDLKMCYS